MRTTDRTGQCKTATSVAVFVFPPLPWERAGVRTTDRTGQCKTATSVAVVVFSPLPWDRAGVRTTDRTGQCKTATSIAVFIFPPLPWERAGVRASDRTGLNREPQHHPRIFMFQQVTVRHVGKRLRCVMVKLHQHLTDAAFHAYRIFPARTMSRRRVAVFR